MAKNVRKLQAEIDRSLKQVDEGIQLLNQLEGRLENANSIQMKEKYETDIKKEIKKLQRHRDFFKQLIKDSEIKDKTRMQEARRKIEDQMEKFRELEKEYKQKKLTKVVYQNHNELESKYRFDSADSDDDKQPEPEQPSNSDSDSDRNQRPHSATSSLSGDNDNHKGGHDRDDDEHGTSAGSSSDKEWCNLFLTESLRKNASALETQMSQLRQNKSKLSVKKNKEKISQLEARLSTVTSLLQKVYEFQPILDLLDGKRLRKVRTLASQYIRTGTTGEDEQSHTNFVQEIDLIIQQFEQNQLPVQILQANKEAQLQAQQPDPVVDERTQFQKDMAQHPECMLETVITVEQLRVGNILDAQDYLGNWHVAIVIDESGPTQKQLHFLPFKANRDELFKADEDNCRLTALYSKTTPPHDKNVKTQFQTLKTYMETYRQKLGKKTEEIKSQQQQKESQQQQPQNNTQPNAQQMKQTAQAKGQQPPLQQDKKKGKPGQKQQPLTQATLSSLPFAPGQPQHSNGVGALAANTTNQDQNRNNNKVREISEDQANQLAQQKMMATNQKSRQPAGGVASQARKDELPSKLNEPAQPGPGLGSLGGAPGAQPGMTTSAPLFTGNPFAFKGINKPAGLILQPQLGGQPATGDQATLGKDAPTGLSMMGGLPSANLKKLNFEDSKEMTSMVDPAAFLQDQPTSKSHHQHQMQQPPQSRIQQGQNAKQRQVLDLLEASFQNKPEPWDQEVRDPKQPVGVFVKHAYPTVPMYAHAANFARFDLETLFFAFYYQQETYQQYLAAVELKKENWLFNKRFETWFKKVEGTGSQVAANQMLAGNSAEAPMFTPNSASQTSGPQQQQRRREFGKYQYFDFENRWLQKISGDDIEMDLNQIENELIVQLSDGPQPAGSSMQMQGRAGQSSGQSQPPPAMSFAPSAAGNPNSQRVGQQQQQQ